NYRKHKCGYSVHYFLSEHSASVKLRKEGLFNHKALYFMEPARVPNRAASVIYRNTSITMRDFSGVWQFMVPKYHQLGATALEHSLADSLEKLDTSDAK